MTDSVCQGMIGFALIEGWLVADKTLVNRRIPQTSNKFQYVAYMTTNKTGDKVEKVELGKGWKKALEIYERKIEGEDNKYSVSIIGHTAHQQWWNIKTAQTGLERYSDVYKMIASYCQKELGLYKKSGYDLKFAQVETLSDK